VIVDAASELKHQPIRDDFRTRVAFERGQRFIDGGVGGRAAARIERTRERRKRTLEIGVAEHAAIAAQREDAGISQQRGQRAQAGGKLIALGARTAALAGSEIAHRIQTSRRIGHASRLLEQATRLLACAGQIEKFFAVSVLDEALAVAKM